jgi:uncharacterized protein (DUF2141 family)
MRRAFILLFLMASISFPAIARESTADSAAAKGVVAVVPTGSIKASFTKVRNGDGQLAVALFSSREGFPVKIARAMAKKLVPANDPKCEVVFENVPYGSYAVSVFHDQNNNGKLDTVFLIGIPKEGVGCSNNPKSRFGPPSFADSKFTLDSREVELTIELKYL